MDFNFDQTIAREQTNSVKFDGRAHYFGTADLVPMWVADMDFATPPCVTRAIEARARHPVLGYTLYPESLYQSLIDWFQHRHQWRIEREWIMMVPGVVPSLHACCQAFAQEGEGVIVQPPVYFPFFSAVTATKRQLVLNPLVQRDGYYQINFDELEQLARSAKLLMLCTPHNPVGRVWSRTELLDVLRIAKKHNLIILSDDIHADLIYAGNKHTMLGTLETDEFGDFIRTNVITAVAPSKTFNIPGLGLSSLIVPNPQHRKLLQQVFDLLHVSAANPFSIAAYEAAYKEGEAWLDELLVYLQKNRDFAHAFVAQQLPEIKLTEPEGTYLLWLDCTTLGMDDARLREFFIRECKLGLSPGRVFGAEGSGYMRMNIGAPLKTVQAAFSALAQGITKL